MRLVNRPICFVDVETNGGYGENARIIDIGIVRIEKNVVVKKLSQLVDPGDRIPSFIERLTGINSQQLESAPTFRQVADEVSQILDGSIFVAHSAAFDYGMMSSEYRRIGEKFEYPVVCSARLSRALFPDFRKHNLDSLIDRHNLYVSNRHRGFDDAYAIWDFYKCCLKDFELDVIEGAIYKQLRKQPQFS